MQNEISTKHTTYRRINNNVFHTSGLHYHTRGIFSIEDSQLESLGCSINHQPGKTITLVSHKTGTPLTFEYRNVDVSLDSDGTINQLRSWLYVAKLSADCKVNLIVWNT